MPSLLHVPPALPAASRIVAAIAPIHNLLASPLQVLGNTLRSIRTDSFQVRRLHFANWSGPLLLSGAKFVRFAPTCFFASSNRFTSTVRRGGKQ